jgi:hypothetical protein
MVVLIKRGRHSELVDLNGRCKSSTFISQIFPFMATIHCQKSLLEGR